MTRQEKKPGRLALIIVSLLWAIALWFYAAEEMSAERDVLVKLTIAPVAGRFVHVDGAEETEGEGPVREVPVWVTLKGPRGVVAGVEGSEVVGRKTIGPDIPSGSVGLTLSPSDFSVPNQPEVKVIGVRPSSVRVFVSEARVKAVPVRVIPVGKPAKGYYISDRPRAVPEQVEVSATPDVLDKVEFLETEPVNVEGRDRSFSIDVRLKKTVNVNGVDKEVFVQSDRVIVFMPVSQEPVEMEVADVPVAVLLPMGTDVRVSLPVKSVPVRVRGAAAKVAAVTASDIKVFVDASRLGEIKEEQDIPLPVRVIPAEGLQVVSGSYPATLNARIAPKR